MTIHFNSEKISSIISNSEIKRSVIKSWNDIEIDEPLIKRHDRLTKSIETNDYFWNVHVALTYFAQIISPTTYLEIGTRTGGSFCPTILSGKPKLAISVDIWEGKYANLPNSREFAIKQIKAFIEKNSLDTEALLLKGSSHDLLENIKQTNLKFELINVDGDHTKKGAWKDLENARELLHESGAIVFDDIQHPSCRFLLDLAYEFAEKYNEFDLILNTNDDNGTAIFTKGIDILKPQNKNKFNLISASNYQNLTNHNATKIDNTFKTAIKRFIEKYDIKNIIETGTYQGEGTTEAICDSIKQSNEIKAFSIEVNENFILKASKFLLSKNNFNRIRILHGLSIPSRLIPSKIEIQKFVNECSNHKLYIDHAEDERVNNYCNEVDFRNLDEDLMLFCLNNIDNKKNTLIILDSAGHLGYIEFNYLLSILERTTYIALDDIYHLKHFKSYQQVKSDSRFEIIFKSNSKFGSLIVKFEP
ncbi:class I SAM-dependent methyltransferase [Opitutales bacterium]|nr:class I SAM-dependent methyltransferase [Opitutales bacterium]